MSKSRDLMNRYMGWDVLTAEFREPDSAAANEHFNALLRRLIPILAAVGTAMTLVFWPFDALMTRRPQAETDAFTHFRLVSLLACVGLLVVTRWSARFRRRPLVGTVSVIVAFSVASGWILGGAHSLSDPVFWVWMMVCYLLLVMPMRLRARIVAHTGALGGFAAAFMVRQEGISMEKNFPVAVTMVFSTLFLSISMGNLVSSLTRRAFRQSRELEAAREESEQLLLSVLPEPVAERLKRDRGAIADRFTLASVMFADLVGFTALAKEQDAEDTVAMLNEVFSAFDELSERFGLEKIKTIGDAYMVVGGVPVAEEDHVRRMCALALAMKARISELGNEDMPLRLRIGIHAGPVVAGVIGSQKLSYDVWGDTVNTASRMESHGVSDAIQVSEVVRDLAGDGFAFEERGVVELKGKGPMKTWFLVGDVGDAGTDVANTVSS